MFGAGWCDALVIETCNHSVKCLVIPSLQLQKRMTLRQLCRAVAQAGGFWSYAAGTAYWLAVEHEVGGMSIVNDRTTLPLKKGLSSSAAACVLVRGRHST